VILLTRILLAILLTVCASTAWGQTPSSEKQARSLGEVVFPVPDIYLKQRVAVGVTPQRRKQAEKYFTEARQFAEQGDVCAALRLTARTLLFDPDHAAARRVLGYENHDGHWAGAYAIRQLKKGLVWHRQFGWIASDDVPKYEAGQRRLGKRWITAEDDARRHGTISDGWRVRTDHFQIATDHSLEAGVRLASRLEGTYQVWLQLCGAFFLEPSDLQRRFAGQPGSSYRSQPFQVVYYRDRAEYNTTLLRQQPRIASTLGIYFDTTRTAHFFAGEDQDPGTLTHEAVHQFFQESAPAARSIGGLANAWAVEGIACYFESLQPVRLAEGLRAWSIGTPEAGRLPAARERCLLDGYYVPLEELSRLGTTDLQRRADLPKLYSQSAGLATFFMQYQNSKYRAAFLKFLQDIYTGRDKPTTLLSVTGQSFAELDHQYRQYLQEAGGGDSPARK
jgi:hypothetical protein